ncbi:CHAT domain-containing protein [Dactylosporangium sp. CA-092794]|uniref:CHAT domain-containing protein n=1 Tax=Dactylosporangium sp. CA-092794 TaxID=3239929 RepID=UPI003D93616D
MGAADDLLRELTRRTDDALLDDDTVRLCAQLQAELDGAAIARDGSLRDDREALRAVALTWWHRLRNNAAAPETGLIVGLLAASSSAEDPALPATARAILGQYADRPEVAFAAPIRHARLAVELLARALDADDRPMLDTAVEALRQAVADLPAGHYRASAEGNLGTALRERYARDHDDRDFDAALAAHHNAIEATPEDDPALPGRMTMLGHAWQERYEWLGDLAALDRAVATNRAALTLAAGAHPNGRAIILAYASTLRERATVAGDADRLEEAIDLLERVAGGAGPDAETAAILSSVASAAISRYQLTGSLGDVTKAVGALRRAVALAGGSPAAAVYHGNLGSALLTRYVAAGDPDDLDAAERHLVTAIAGQPPDPEVELRRGTLALVGLRRFERTGDAALLADAITTVREVFDRLPETHPDRAGVLANLAILLYTRFERLGEPADLDAAVEQADRAVRTTPEGHPHRPGRVANLASILRARFFDRGTGADLDEAVRILRPIAEGRGAEAAACGASLGTSLLLRFDFSDDTADLDEAVRILAGVVDGGSVERPDWAGYASEYGRALIARHRAGADPDGGDLALAATLLERAAAQLPGGHPLRAPCLVNLALAHRTAYRETHEDAAVERALASYALAGAEPGGAARVRYQAAVSGGQLAMEAGRGQDALAAYEHAVALLPRMAWQGLQRGQQERILAAEAGVTADAAAVAIRLGRLDRALELLEQGRGVLWGQQAPAHDDLAKLRAASPDRAEALLRVLAALDTASAGLRDTTRPGPVAPAREQAADHRVRLNAELDRLLGEIRADPRFARFWLAPAADRLRSAAAEGPVVVPLVSQYGAHALVLRGSEPIRRVDLPAVETEALLSHSLRYARVLLAMRTGDPAAAGTATRHLDRILAWLWRTIAEPVLRALELRPVARQTVRLWWCPSGLLALLPLHAAQRFDDATLADVGVADHVISSYTPTLRALIATRTTAPRPVTAAVLVALRRTPNQPDLPHVTAEIDAVRAALPVPVEVIDDERATLERVRERMPASQWLHFAGHSRQDLDAPGDTCLHLADGPLTVAGIGALDLPEAQLAFLASCESSVGSPSLPDEALHLAGALLVAGFGHVISTRWAVPDAIAARLTGAVYESLCSGDGPLDVGVAAQALHEAVRSLRHGQPSVVWAPYCHTGR